MRGQLGEVECCVRKAEVAANLGQAAPNAEAKAALAEIQTIRAALISLQGDTERGCELAQRALAETPQEDLHLQGLAHFSLGTALSYAGRVVEAIEAYEQALPLCQASGNTVISMLIVANLALLHTVRGQLRAAADLCRRVIEATEGPSRPLSPAVATVYGNYDSVLYEWDRLDAAYGDTQKWLELSKRGGHVAAGTYGHVLPSRILQGRGDIATAVHVLKEAIQLLARGMPAWVTASVVSQEVSLALARGEPATAWQALSRTGVSIDDESNHQREVIQIAYLRLLHYLGREGPQGSHLDRALNLASQLLKSAGPAGRMGRVIELFLVYIALFTKSLCAFVLALMSIDLASLPNHFSVRLPRRAVAFVLFAVGGFLLLAWSGRIIPPLVEDRPPFGLESYTTLVIQALDLGLIVPLAILGGVLLLRRSAWGYLLASIALIKGFTMATAVTTMAFALLLGGEVVSPVEMTVFPLLTGLIIGMTVILMKNVRETGYASS